MARVLVVDDARVARAVLREALQAAGHEVVEAPNATEGLKAAVETRPDCITTDLLMPGIDGLTFIDTLRARGVHTPVVVVTADIQRSTREECMRRGVAAVLAKPVERAQLARAVDEALASRPRAALAAADRGAGRRHPGSDQHRRRPRRGRAERPRGPPRDAGRPERRAVELRGAAAGLRRDRAADRVFRADGLPRQPRGLRLPDLPAAERLAAGGRAHRRRAPRRGHRLRALGHPDRGRQRARQLGARARSPTCSTSRCATPARSTRRAPRCRSSPPRSTPASRCCCWCARASASAAWRSRAACCCCSSSARSTR